MDVPPPARPVAAAGPDLRGAPPSPPAPGNDVSARLVALESAVADLARRVDALAASSEASEAAVGAAVAREVQGVAADLRHTVSELGRLLVRDLGKLSKMLAEHRDTILAEVRGPGGSAAEERTPDPEAGEPVPAGEELDAAAADAALAAQPGDAAEAGTTVTPGDDAERSWRRRRRQS